MQVPVYSVTQVNQYIKSVMDRDELLAALFVRGEISNYKRYPSGHHYFSLKDATGAIRCVMFRTEAGRLKFQPENGMKVVALGRISVFPRDGQYQLYCNELIPEGAGDLHVAFEQQKERLYQEGLFDPEKKKPLPKFPMKIALITSPAGAAVRDMLRILKARFPVADVVIVPVRVQGEEAAGEIAGAIDLANALGLADLIITGRGGGSMEDLWAFNEEIVARAIFRSHIPVISAVGHEPDVTIADFVADLRAATPSNGAELAVPDRADLKRQLAGMEQRMEKELLGQIQSAREALARIGKSRMLTDPRAGLLDRRMLLDRQGERLAREMKLTLERSRVRLSHGAGRLHALSPLAVLGRGYAIPWDEKGNVVRSVEETKPGQRIGIQLADGQLTCRVEEKGRSENG